MLSVIIGSVLSEKMNRFHFFYVWIIFGIIASFLPLLLQQSLLSDILIISFSFGFSFGIGMPASGAYFADCTVFENRGRSSGLIFFLTFLIAPILFILIGDNVIVFSAISLVWRAVVLVMFFVFKPKKVKIEQRKHCSFLSVIRNKPFLLYMVPWLMFCLVDRLERVYLEAIFEPWFFEFFVVLVAPFVGLIFSLVGGLIADFIGRKRVIVTGFIAIGVEYALLGLAPTLLVSWYGYAFIDGIAWGVFMVIFILLLWGDLSQDCSSREKYYAIGSIPFFFAELVGIFFRPFMQGIPKESAYAAFSLASFFLFIAVVPLMYAPETMPQKNIEQRRLKGYIEQAKKVSKKHLKKNGAEG
jgi:MFS family permease